MCSLSFSYYKVPLELQLVNQFKASGKREQLITSVTFAPKKKAYSIPADSIDDIKGADEIAKDMNPAAATA